MFEISDATTAKASVTPTNSILIATSTSFVLVLFYQKILSHAIGGITLFDITPIIEAVAALIAVIITAVVIPYIKSKTTTQQQAQINAWVKIAVAAAEQIYKGSGRGEEKKEYVINWLEERGFTLDEDEVDALIESAVYELNNGIIPIENVTITPTEAKILVAPEEKGGEANGN